MFLGYFYVGGVSSSLYVVSCVACLDTFFFVVKKYRTQSQNMNVKLKENDSLYYTDGNE